MAETRLSSKINAILRVANAGGPVRIHRLAILNATLLLAVPADAEDRRPNAPPIYGYAELADRALAAPVAAVASIAKASRLKAEDAGSVPAGFARFYVEADIEALIRGPRGLASHVAYLVDMAIDGKGRSAPLKKQRVIVLAAPVAGRPAELRLIARGGQLVWSAPTEAMLRAILVAANDPAAAPRVTGVAGAFHVPGSLPGESETQIFLTTEDGRPVSLNVLRRPGEDPRWAVALSEMVDEAAEPPARDTLLWYRLACTLPPVLPASSTANLDPDAATAARADYSLVIEGLGACGRTGG